MEFTTEISEKQELIRKLDASEKSIKECKEVIEELINQNSRLEEENNRLEKKLVRANSKTRSAEFTTLCSAESTSPSVCRENLNLELQDISLKRSQDEKKMLLRQLEASENQICSLTASVQTLLNKSSTYQNEERKHADEMKALEEEKKMLEDEIKERRHNENRYENEIISLRNKLILKEIENEELKSVLDALDNANSQMNYNRKALHQEIENLCKALLEDDGEDNERRKYIYKEAVLRTAQALLDLDSNFKSKAVECRNSLDEMEHQRQVYLYEGSRIHELTRNKEQAREELLRPDDTLRPSTSRHTSDNNLNAPDDKPSVDKLDALESFFVSRNIP